MKLRRFVIGLMAALPAIAQAQTVRPQAASPVYITGGTAAPSGICPANQIYVQTEGSAALWLCDAGTWTAAGGGGSGFTAAGDLSGSSTSQQVVSTHLTSALPVAQGGAYTAHSWETGTAAVSSSDFAAANILKLWGKEIQVPLRISNLAFWVTTADTTAGDYYSFGIYGPSAACSTTCPLVAHTAPASYASTGAQDVALAEGTVTLAPGIYFFGYTGNASTMSVVVAGAASSQRQGYVYQSSTLATSGGAQSATITAPALATVIASAAANILPYLFLSQN